MCLVFSWLLTLSVAFSMAEKQICTYHTTFRVISADCSRRMLEDLPTELPSDIQVFIIYLMALPNSEGILQNGRMTVTK
jgi:hypothetical protein